MTEAQKELLLIHLLATTSPINYRPKDYGSGTAFLQKITADCVALGIVAAGWDWPGLGGTGAVNTPAVQFANELVSIQKAIYAIQNSAFTPAATSIGWAGGGSEHPSLTEVTTLVGI